MKANLVSDPFARHREADTQPEPVQTQPVVETTAIDQPISTEPKAPNDQSDPTAQTQPSSPFAAHVVESKARPKPERTQKPLSAQELLYWLQHNWTEPTISLRDVQNRGPRPVRDRQSATRQIEALASQGWLVELKAHRRDRRIWRLPPAMVTRIA
jgi:hypothetical protein